MTQSNQSGAVEGGISPLVNYTAPNDIVEEQLNNIRELYDIEPDNKWVILTYLDMVHTCNALKTKEQVTLVVWCGVVWGGVVRCGVQCFVVCCVMIDEMGCGVVYSRERYSV